MTSLTSGLSLSLGFAALALAAPVAQAEQFASAHAAGHCISSTGGQATIQGCASGASAQNIAMRWIPAENVFFGALQIDGQCLEDRGQGQPLAFAGCNGSKAQEWKLTGANGVLNSGQNRCADLPNGTRATGAALIAWPCNGGSNQKWWNNNSQKIRVIAVTNMRPVAVGTVLRLSGDKLIANDGASIVASGGGNIVASGGGNMVAGAAGNIVAGGAGN